MSQSRKRYLKVLMNLGIALVTLLLTVFLLPKALVYFMPFLIGYLIAMIASPIVRFFEEKLKIRRKAGSAFVIVAVIALVIMAIYLVGAKLVEQLIGLTESLPDMWKSAESDFAQIGQKFDVFISRLPEDFRQSFNGITSKMDSFLANIVEKISTPTITAVGSFAKQLPNALIGIIMCLLSAYFFVAEKDYLNNFCRKYTPYSFQKRWTLLIRSLKRAVGGYFKAQFKIEVFVYILLLIGLSVLGIDYAILIALGIAILDVLPFFGTGTVMIPWAIIKFLSSDYKMTIGLLIIWGAGQLFRQLIQPKIVGDSIGVAPIPTLFLLYIGYKAGGVIGMIIAVPVGLILQNMNEEGLFDTTKNSLRILVAQINQFRKLDKNDLACITVETEKDNKTQKNSQNNE